MTATFAREELELAALLLVIDDDGAYRWSSDKTREEVGVVLGAIAGDLVLEAIAEAPDAAAACALLGDWHRSAISGLEETLRRGVTAARAAGATWSDVGVAFGISRQAAWERLRRFDQLGIVDPVEELIEEGAGRG